MRSRTWCGWRAAPRRVRSRSSRRPDTLCTTPSLAHSTSRSISRTANSSTWVFVFTLRQRSCGKVVFSQMFVFQPGDITSCLVPCHFGRGPSQVEGELSMHPLPLEEDPTSLEGYTLEGKTPSWYWQLASATQTGSSHPTGIHDYLTQVTFQLLKSSEVENLKLAWKEIHDRQ